MILCSLMLIDGRPPARLFTDGAWKQNQGGAGAVLFWGPSDIGRVAEVLVPSQLVEAWGAEGSAQLIAKFELFPVLAALLCWGKELSGRRVFIFVDNNGVRDPLIKGTSPIPNLFAILALIASTVRALDITPWYTRVASASNPADAPSRQQAHECAKDIGAELYPPLEFPDRMIAALASSNSFLSITSRSPSDSAGDV